MRMKSVGRSVSVSIAFLPTIVSISQSPECLPSASSDLSWMPMRPGMFPALSVQFGLPYFMPWRQCPAGSLLSSARTYQYISSCDMSLLSFFMYSATCFGDYSSRLTCFNASRTTMLSLRLFSMVRLRRSMVIPRTLFRRYFPLPILSRLNSREGVD